MRQHYSGLQNHSIIICYIVILKFTILSLSSFCLKGEALDGKSPAVIDFTPYLKFTQR